MTQPPCIVLMLVYVYRDIDIDYESIISTYAYKDPRRMLTKNPHEYQSVHRYTDCSVRCYEPTTLFLCFRNESSEKHQRRKGEGGSWYFR